MGFLSDIGSSIGDAFDSVTDTIGGAFDSITDGVSSAVDTVGDLASGVGDFAGDAVDTVGDVVGELGVGKLADGLFGGGDGQDVTSEEKALAAKGAKDWNRYVRDIVPVSDVYADQIEADDSAAASVDRGVVNNVRNGGFADGLESAATNNLSSPGAMAMQMQDRNNSADAAVAKGSVRGATQLMDREQRGLLSLAASGRGVRNNGTKTLASAGQDAQRLAAAEAQNDRAISQGLMSGAATGAGVYVGEHGNPFANNSSGNGAPLSSHPGPDPYMG